MLLPEWVWNKGIAASCNWRIPDEFPNAGEYVAYPRQGLIENPDFFRDIQDGDLVWVRLEWIDEFIREVLPRVQARFVLATGDSDNSVPSRVPSAAATLLRDARVIRWFAQNCQVSDPRLRPLPIGIDYHTISERPFWGEQKTSPLDQERGLNAIAATLLPVEHRVKQVYLDFVTMGMSYGWRWLVAESLSKNPCAVFQSKRLPRSEMWRQRGAFAFVVSPLGCGLDCHRTWEALALGHIVLVPASPLDRLFVGLPVVSVKDWNDVTPAKLDMWLDMYGPLTRENQRCTTRWWVDEMRVAARRKCCS